MKQSIHKFLKGRNFFSVKDFLFILLFLPQVAFSDSTHDNNSTTEDEKLRCKENILFYSIGSLDDLKSAFEEETRNCSQIVSVDVRDLLGRTALMHAAKEGKKDNVNYLLSKGADKTLKDTYGFNAATFASYHNHDDIAEILGGSFWCIRVSWKFCFR